MVLEDWSARFDAKYQKVGKVIKWFIKIFDWIVS